MGVIESSLFKLFKFWLFRFEKNVFGIDFEVREDKLNGLIDFGSFGKD